MASKRVCCRWCRMVSVVPLEAQGLYCPSCRGFTMVARNYNTSNQGQGYAYAENGRVYQRMPPPPSHGYGRKRAVLCGITYKGHRQSLRGSVNDVLSMKNLLIRSFQFPLSCILVLTEEEEDYRRAPTKRNIRNALRWLVEGSQAGDSLVFHYSGHGSQVRDRDGDEVDGYDEALLPVDYETEGRILDDELNATIVRPLPAGATLHAIIDTCFSGTFLDLPNVCRIDRQAYYNWEDQRIQNGGAYRGTSGGFAVSISACDDHQSSGDTTAFTGTATGALTYSFVQTLEQEKRLSYGHLLIALHKRIAAAQDAVGLNRNDSHSSQEPQLSSSHKFDIHSKNFTL
ncbi:metacaspase-3-like isoform X2 [Salvia miltiorrhiza]|uniref:metacaspase-3-like isoform X2 n=1 Tax=Salvia miltiorrhiza TaxID=226208 RepID=UPI0025AB70B1|nr:metacaspase-3-like isoform X2 [Salvia miltiorrhiza]